MRIVCLGSGNVATHFAKALAAAGAEILQVWSRNADHALLLADTVGASPISDLKEIDLGADLYLIALKDDAIASVAEILKAVEGIVVHTSGATDIKVLSSLKKYGVFYPLQTFSKQKEIVFSNVPLCLEAGDAETLQFLQELANSLGSIAYEVDSEKRRVLHLAAVFACNFVNHLYTLSHQLLDKHALDFDIIKPLIIETADKVRFDLPENVQTGPAARGDQQTMDAHLKMLAGESELTHIYQIFSDSIKKTRE